MKKLVFFLFSFLLSSIFSMAQTTNQPGVVNSISYSYGEDGAPIEGVRIKVITEVRSNGNGEFVVPVLNTKNNLFTFIQIEKEGFELITPTREQLLNEQFAINPGAKVHLVMASKESLFKEKRRIETNIRKEFEKLIAEKNSAIDSLMSLYDRLLKESSNVSMLADKLKVLVAERDSLSNVYYDSDAYIEEEARKLSRIDYQSLRSEEEAVILEIKKSGQGLEVVKAAKSLLPEGVLEKLESDPSFYLRDYEKSRKETASKYDALIANRRLIRDIYEGYRMSFRHDSAAYYLKIYADMDKRDNAGILEYASFISNNLNHYSEAIEYLDIILAQRKMTAEKITAQNMKASIFQSMSQYDKALKMYETALADAESMDDKEIKAEILHNLGTLYSVIGNYPSAIDCMHSSLDLHEETNADSITLSSGYISIAQTYSDAGDFEEACKYLTKVESLLADKIDVRELSSTVGFFYSTKANYYSTIGQLDSALVNNFKALEVLKSYYGEDHEKIASLMNNIGLIYGKMGAYNEGMDMLNKALDIEEKIFGKMNLNSYTTQLAIAQILNRSRRYKEALNVYNELIDDLSASYGSNYLLSILYSDAAGCLEYFKEYDEALKYYEESLQIGLDLFGKETKETARTRNNLGLLYNKMEEYDKAIKYLKESNSIEKEIYGPKNINVVESMINLAGCLFNKGDIDECFSILPEIESIIEANPSNPRLSANVYRFFSSCYSDIGEYDKAVGCIERSNDILKQVGDQRELVLNYNSLADIYENRHYYSEAIKARMDVLNVFMSYEDSYLDDMAYQWYKVSSDYYALEEYDACREYAIKAYNEFVELRGLDYEGTVASKQILDFCDMLSKPYIVLAQIKKDGQASRQGLSGNLIVLRVNEYDISGSSNLMAKAIERPIDFPMSALFMDTDFNFFEYSSDRGVIGAQFKLMEVSPDLRQQFVQAYEEYINQ